MLVPFVFGCQWSYRGRLFDLDRSTLFFDFFFHVRYELFVAVSSSRAPSLNNNRRLLFFLPPFSRGTELRGFDLFQVLWFLPFPHFLRRFALQGLPLRLSHPFFYPQDFVCFPISARAMDLFPIYCPRKARAARGFLVFRGDFCVFRHYLSCASLFPRFFLGP